MNTENVNDLTQPDAGAERSQFAPAQGSASLWQVQVTGPDDVFDHTDELTALRQANNINRGVLDHRKGHENDENWPFMMAVVERVAETQNATELSDAGE